jgi:hypothetical protein
MTRMQQLAIPEMCDLCGENPVTLYTRADQREKPEHCSYWADDEDKVVCPDCGARGMVSADDGIATIKWDSVKAKSSDSGRKNQ